MFITVDYKAWTDCIANEVTLIYELVRRETQSDGRREADALVGHVELGVVLADEHVAQDPQRPVGRRDVQPHEARQAHRLAELRHLHTHCRQPALRRCQLPAASCGRPALLTRST